MLVSTEIYGLSKRIGEIKTIESCAKAGFDAFDLSMFAMTKREANNIYLSDHPLGRKNYLSFVRELKKVAQDNGIFCNQSHAPYYAYMGKVKGYLKRAIECTAEIGAKICVIHPDAFGSVEENTEMYLELLPFAKEHGVKIATENIWNFVNGAVTSVCGSDETSIKRQLQQIEDNDFCVCLDIGHAEMKGVNTSAVKMINAIGNRLLALHIHDNDLLRDNHLMPGRGKIAFDPIIRALKENGYKGEFTLEADNHYLNVPDENLFEEVKSLYNSVRLLADKFESL